MALEGTADKKITSQQGQHFKRNGSYESRIRSAKVHENAKRLKTGLQKEKAKQREKQDIKRKRMEKDKEREIE